MRPLARILLGAVPSPALFVGCNSPQNTQEQLGDGLEQATIAAIVERIKRIYPPSDRGREFVLWNAPDRIADALTQTYAADDNESPTLFHRPDDQLRFEDGEPVHLSSLLPTFASPASKPPPSGTTIQLRPPRRPPTSPPPPDDETTILLWEQDINDFIDLTSALPELLRARASWNTRNPAPRWGDDATRWKWHPGAPGADFATTSTSPFDPARLHWQGGTYTLLRRSLDILPVSVGSIQVSLADFAPSTEPPPTARLYWTTRSHPSRRRTHSLISPLIDNRFHFPVGESPRWLAGGEVTTISLILRNAPEGLVANKIELLPPAPESFDLPAQVDPIFIQSGALIWGSDGADPLRYPSEAENDTILVPGFGIDPYPWPGRAGVYPTVNVTLFEARYLCRIQGKRLCRETEWERACKGPRNLPYPYGRHFDPNPCFTAGDFDRFSARRNGAFPGCVSGFGIADMSGNINEWTSSVITREEAQASPRETSSSIFDSESEFPPGAPPIAQVPMLRGGGDWGESQSEWRCAHREHFHLPTERYRDDGFRCCKSR